MIKHRQKRRIKQLIRRLKKAGKNGEKKDKKDKKGKKKGKKSGKKSSTSTTAAAAAATTTTTTTSSTIKASSSSSTTAAATTIPASVAAFAAGLSNSDEDGLVAWSKSVEDRLNAFQQSCVNLKKFVDASEAFVAYLGKRSKLCRSPECLEVYHDRISQVAENIERHGRRCSQVSGINLDAEDDE